MNFKPPGGPIPVQRFEQFKRFNDPSMNRIRLLPEQVANQIAAAR